MAFAYRHTDIIHWKGRGWYNLSFEDDEKWHWRKIALDNLHLHSEETVEWFEINPKGRDDD